MLSRFSGIFSFEIKKVMVTSLIWTIAWGLMTLLNISFFDSINENADDINQLFEQFPEEILSTLSADAQSITQVEGYYNAQVFVLYLLATGIFGVFLGINVLSREIRNKSIVFLLTKTSDRNFIFFSKLSSLTFVNIVSNLLFVLFGYLSYIFFTSAEDISIKFFFYSYIIAILFTFLSTIVGLILGLVFGDSRGLGIGVLIFIGTFMINAVSGLEGVPGFVKFTTPYYYLGTDKLAQTQELFMPEILVILAVSILIMLISNRLFHQENIEV